jgi:predicted RNA polymerase sigma factor
VLGLSVQVIASAFLIAPATIGKCLVRAKEKIRQAGIPFAIPAHDELAGRDAIYAAYAEGWADPGGTAIAHRDLSELERDPAVRRFLQRR